MPRDTVFDFLVEKTESSCDTECFPNYWCIGFEDIETGRVEIFDHYAGHPLDRDAVRRILKRVRFYTFNGKTYDIPMICLAMQGADNATLKRCNDDMIVRRIPQYKILEKYNITIPSWLDHIDLFDVSPGVRLSLKKYGARMNMQRLAETPIPFDQPLKRGDIPKVHGYLRNDLATTSEMKRRLPDELNLRTSISQEYQLDVRSKSDAQIAEALITAEVTNKTGSRPPKPVVKTFSFKYEAPDFIEYETPLMRRVLDVVTSARFFVDAQDDNDRKNYGVVRLPKDIKELKIRIGDTDYKMGIGGLHSQEKCRSFTADEDTIIEDVDVRAYYPWLMIACGYVPAALGNNFLGVFTKFVKLRDSYKIKAAMLEKAGETEKALVYKRYSDSFKIVNNGTFGKTGSPYSVLYSPRLLIGTTITGQLSLLMLIERLDLAGFNVISANTDGIVTVIPKKRYGEFKTIVFDWECDTHLTTEAVRYAGVFSRDVNSYIALPHDFATNPKAKVKRKGLFAKAGLQEKHDPTFDICSTAVVDYLTKNADIEKTIRACADITQFLGVKQIGKQTGGGFKNGEFLGHMVRWYMGEGETGFITKGNGARVAGTTGAVVCMDLPDEFPDDIDYHWYIREAYGRLNSIGVKVRDPRLAGRFGYVRAALPGQKTVHLIDLRTRKSMCGKVEKKVHEEWVEYGKGEVPVTMRVCKRCMEERGYDDEEEEEDAL